MKSSAGRKKFGIMLLAVGLIELVLASCRPFLPPPANKVVGGNRPVPVQEPAGFDNRTPAPLIIALHGYGSDSLNIDNYLGVRDAAYARGILFASPSGTTDRTGQQFWNATDACCDIYGSGVDDTAYLTGIINEIKNQWNVDPRRVYFVGHSNGAFMSHRMACDRSADIAAIAVLQGPTWANQAMCRPSTTVSLLQIHATGDLLLPYEGGFLDGVAIPGARETVRRWASFDGCSLTPATPPPAPRNIVTGADPATVEAYSTGCAPGGHAELWTQPGSDHVPALNGAFGEQVVDFLMAHPKP